MTKKRKNLAKTFVPPALCLLLLASIFAEAHSRVQPGSAEPFHARAKLAIDSIAPTLESGWISEAQDIGPAATALLKPNAVFNRAYKKTALNGRDLEATFLIVQCKDARDMQGHYPPRCYPANGAKMTSVEPRTWTLGQLPITGMEYSFSRLVGGRLDEFTVYNFFIIPAIPGIAPSSVKGIQPDITAIYKSGEDYQRRYYGAAEFQLVFDANYNQQDRDQMLEELLGPNLNVIQTLMNDPSAQHLFSVTEASVPATVTGSADLTLFGGFGQ